MGRGKRQFEKEDFRDAGAAMVLMFMVIACRIENLGMIFFRIGASIVRIRKIKIINKSRRKTIQVLGKLIINKN